MPIIIPSNSIYKIQNDKILNNAIKQIEANVSSFVVKNAIDRLYDSEFVSFESSQNYATIIQNDTENLFLGYLAPKYIKPTIKIPYTTARGSVQGRPTELLINIKGTTVSGECNLDGIGVTFEAFRNYLLSSQITDWNTTIKSEIYSYYSVPGSVSLSNEFLSVENLYDNYLGYDVYNFVIDSNSFNALDAPRKSEGQLDSVYSILCGCSIVTAQIDMMDGNYYARGTYTTYTPESISIIANGNITYYDQEISTKKFGESNDGKSNITFENEFIKEDSFYKLNENSTSENLVQKLCTETLNNYANGKETARVLCSISNYKDESNNIVISIDDPQKEMFFKEGDIVIPLTRKTDADLKNPFMSNEYGKDKPMSLDVNGNAKLFRIVGTRVYYDGAVWQEIYLQEN